MERYNFRNIERKWGIKNSFQNVCNKQAKKKFCQDTSKKTFQLSKTRSTDFFSFYFLRGHYLRDQKYTAA